MKTPWYETSPGATEALLFSGQFVDQDLYTFTLASPLGTPGVDVLRYCSNRTPVTIPGPNGGTWVKGPLFDRNKARGYTQWKTGLDVDDLQVAVAPRLISDFGDDEYPDTIGVQPWLQAVAAGALDGALVQVDRVVAPGWSGNPNIPFSPTGVFTMFTGAVGEVDVGRSQAVIVAYSHLKKFTQQMPRNVFQVGCIWTLFDQGCSLDVEDFIEPGVVTSLGATGNVFGAIAATPGGSGTYALGRVEMTSGASAGFARTVRSWTQGTTSVFTLIAPMPFGINPGDNFIAVPGCNKTPGQCVAFNNLQNYGGFLSIPPVETAT